MKKSYINNNLFLINRGMVATDGTVAIISDGFFILKHHKDSKKPGKMTHKTNNDGALGSICNLNNAWPFAALTIGEQINSLMWTEVT